MRRTTEKEIESVLRLDGPKRFDHFVKRVADEERVWSLWDSGWTLMEEEGGQRVFPVWPAREYAERCCIGGWSKCEVREVPLAELLEQLLPELDKAGLRVGVFPTPEGKGVVITPGELDAHLRKELEKYE